MEDIIYFELNNWFAGRDYPDAEPFLSWMRDDLNQTFRNDEWVKENKLCVVFTPIDMSQNYCITATKDWVLKNCPDLLSDKEYDTKFITYGREGNKEHIEHYSFKQFLRFPDKHGDIYSKFGMEFLPYEEENFGVTTVYYDNDYEDWIEDDEYLERDEEEE